MTDKKNPAPVIRYPKEGRVIYRGGLESGVFRNKKADNKKILLRGFHGWEFITSKSSSIYVRCKKQYSLLAQT